MKRRILVTAISGDVANCILKVLQNTNHDDVYGCDIYDYPAGMDRVIGWWKSDLAISPNYIPNLIHKCKKYKITHLIPVNEVEIKIISMHLQDFLQAGIKVMINAPDIINIFQDKYESMKFLNKINVGEGNSHINTPVTFLYDEFKEDGTPYIVKLRNSSGSKFLHKIVKKSEMDEYGMNPDELVFQEYIPDDDHEYTVGVYSNGKRTSSIAFRRKLKHGYTSFVEYVKEPSICREAEYIAKAINLHGYINLQLRRFEQKNYIFEINARISGSIYFQYLLGHDVINWWLDLLDGIEGYQYKCKYNKAIGIRELAEKYVVLEEGE